MTEDQLKTLFDIVGKEILEDKSLFKYYAGGTMRIINEVLSILNEELKSYHPTVKQLEWHKHENCVYAYGYMDEKNDIDIVYEIQKYAEQSTTQGYHVSTPTDDDHNTYATLEEAKAAAQSHFEALILGCLED